jgi:hypothetical protein
MLRSSDRATHCVALDPQHGTLKEGEAVPRTYGPNGL